MVDFLKRMNRSELLDKANTALLGGSLWWWFAGVFAGKFIARLLFTVALAVVIYILVYILIYATIIGGVLWILIG